MLTDQQNEELNFLNAYQLFSNEQFDVVVNVDSDPPDLAAMVDGNAVSIEVSRLVAQDGKRKKVAHSGLVSGILKEIQAHFSHSHVPAFHACISFDVPLDIVGRRREFVKGIIACIEMEFRNNGIKEYALIARNLPPGVREIELTINPEIRTTSFCDFSESPPSDRAIQILRQVILRKHNKSLKKGYFKSYAQNWLLLVVEDWDHSTFRKLFRYDLSSIKKYGFDKVLLVDLEMKVAKSF
jgi:hypothetical protein